MVIPVRADDVIVDGIVQHYDSIVVFTPVSGLKRVDGVLTDTLNRVQQVLTAARQ